MKPKTISIIGGNGKIGKLFADEFEKQGYDVLISDIGTELLNIEVAKRGDIVIVSVPIRKTRLILSEIVKYVKEDALLTDMTSVKVNPIKVMKKNSICEISGGHPLFGPSVGFKDQNFILTPVRTGKYYEWYKNFLEGLGLKVIEMSPQKHDKEMAIIQCLIHFSNISLGYSLKKLKYDIESGQEISSPVYNLRMYNVGRILSQDEKLYSDIQIENPYSARIARTYMESVKELNKAISRKDKKGFEKIFLSSKSHFSKILRKSQEITDRLIKIMGDNK